MLEFNKRDPKALPPTRQNKYVAGPRPGCQFIRRDACAQPVFIRQNHRLRIDGERFHDHIDVHAILLPGQRDVALRRGVQVQQTVRMLARKHRPGGQQFRDTLARRVAVIHPDKRHHEIVARNVPAPPGSLHGVRGQGWRPDCRIKAVRHIERLNPDLAQLSLSKARQGNHASCGPQAVDHAGRDRGMINRRNGPPVDQLHRFGVKAPGITQADHGVGLGTLGMRRQDVVANWIKHRWQNGHTADLRGG